MNNDFHHTIIERLNNNRDPSKFIEISKNDMVNYRVAGGSYFLLVGRIALEEGYLHHAIKSFELALSLEFDKEAQKGPTLQLLGACYHNTGEYEKALECHLQALRKGQEGGDRFLIMESLYNIGREHLLLANTNNAKIFFKKSLAVALEEKHKVMIVKCYYALGTLYFDSSDYLESIEVCNKAINIKQTIPEVIYETEIIEAQCYELIGQAYSKLLMFEQTIEYYKKSLNMYKKIGDKNKISALLLNIGVCYMNILNYKQSIEYLKQALVIANRTKDYSIMALCYSNLGHVLYYSNSMSAAKYNFTQALAVSNKIDNSKRIQSISYFGLGAIERSYNEHEKASENYKKALELAQGIGRKDLEAYCYLSMSRSYFDMAGKDFSNLNKAILFCQKALDIADAESAPSYLLISLSAASCLGQYYSAMDLPEQSLVFLKKSIEIIEYIGHDLNKGKIEFYGNTSQIYEDLIVQYIRLNEKEKAFEYLERSKSKSFLDMIRKPEDEEGGISLFTQVKKFNTEMPRFNIFEFDGSFKPLYLTKNLGKNDKTGAISDSNPLKNILSVTELQELIRIEKEKSIILEYFLLYEVLFIFVITAHEFIMKQVQLPEHGLNRYLPKGIDFFSYEPPPIIFLHPSFGSPENYKDLDPNLKEYIELGKYRKAGRYDTLNFNNNFLNLSEFLIKPVADYISQSELIYVIPYGDLHHVPYHALIYSNEPLIKTHKVVYCPSASILQSHNSKQSRKLTTRAVFGATFNEEAQAIAKILDTSAFVEATKKQVYDNLDKDILHFSCHGYYSKSNPMESGLVLSDHILKAKEITKLRLNSTLVTLSACSSGQDKVMLGDEFIGLIRSFMYAGVSYILSTLWEVDPVVTKEFMIEFYEQMKFNNIPTALQKAQNKITDKYFDLTHWAPFFLILA